MVVVLLLVLKPSLVSFLQFSRLELGLVHLLQWDPPRVGRVSRRVGHEPTGDAAPDDPPDQPKSTPRCFLNELHVLKVLSV